LSNNDIPKSFGHTHVLPPHKRDDSGAFEVFESLLYKAIDRLQKHRVGAKRVTIYMSWRNTETKRRKTFKVSSPITIASCDFKFWTKIALGLWNTMPELELRAIPLLVGVRFTRTIKVEDMNLQLFDLNWNSDYIYQQKYNLPDRISFGDPGRLFEDN
jgi:DNA polymerase-4